MNRYFISDKESDILITVATKVFGLKIGDIINMAIKNEFLPMTEPFRTEATFILQCRAENKLDAWEIKQSMTRGIRALGTRPVYDADRLQGFFARYHLQKRILCIDIRRKQKGFCLVRSLVCWPTPPNRTRGIFSYWGHLAQVRQVRC